MNRVGVRQIQIESTASRYASWVGVPASLGIVVAFRRLTMSARCCDVFLPSGVSGRSALESMHKLWSSEAGPRGLSGVVWFG